MNAKIFSLAAALMALFGTSLQGVTLVSYDFSGQPGNQTTTSTSVVASGLSADPLSRGAGLGSVAFADSMSGTGWDVGDFTPSDNDYFEFSITPDSGYEMDVTSIDLSILRSSSGAKNYAIFTSLDNYASAATNTYLDIGTGTQNLSFTFLTPSNFEGLASGLTLRLYGWNATTGGAAYLQSTFTASGSVNVVPEPSTYALFMSLGLVAYLVCRRHLRK